MRGKKITRRNFVIRCAQIPVAGVFFSSLVSCGDSDSDSEIVCADPDDMTSGERAFRDSSYYVEQSLNASQSCKNCAYFSASPPDSACGSCEIFNGPANRDGHCNVWSEIS